MECHYCGEKEIDPLSNYCPFCGKKVFMNEQEWKHYRISKRALIILPAASIGLVWMLLTAADKHEAAINDKVISYQQKAEDTALAGEYEKALDFADKGLALREDYRILEQEKELLLGVLQDKEDLDQINAHIQKGNLDQAAKQIAVLSKTFSGHSSPLYTKLKAELEQADRNVTVAEVKKEIETLNTIEELSEKLKEVTVLDAAEAGKVKEQIKAKMVLIGSSAAEEDLEEKQFNAAIVSVDKALQYDGDNEKLLSLKEKILSERTHFEQAEQNRLKQIALAANEEKERTDKVLKTSNPAVEEDEFGDAHITGKVKNISGAPVQSITIYYTVKNEEGTLIEKGKTNVFPNELKPGEEAEYSHISYGVKQEVSFAIERMTWHAGKNTVTKHQ
ncbi:FxLYD domain-containing protein [Metabacillus indicus]|uniref:FxLYD domain-containing protein n=1 Tax=Metabacillus indicus TaxID=246786 RepID=UPI002490527F|nr:FxLYD domain-containing protein [Metabacillus indicus]